MSGIKVNIGIDYRPCMVGDRKGLFHQWVNNDKILIKCTTIMSQDQLQKAHNAIFGTGIDNIIIPAEYEVYRMDAVSGLVEFEDGSIKLVPPTDIRFLDSGSLFHEYDFREEK